MVAPPVTLDFSVLFRKVLQPYLTLAGTIAMIVAMVFLALLVYAQMKYRFPMPLRFVSRNPLRNARYILRLRRIEANINVVNFIKWVIIDLMWAEKKRNEFNECGLTLYCGRQGRGKTVSMVNYLLWIHRRYPKCIIVTNFWFRYADYQMTSWHDFMNIRNGIEGVVFAIDEIHSEYSSDSWKDFPESLLSEISQQRKQRIKIVATAQIFTRVVKQLREQADTVVQCQTTAGRWTRGKEYDAKDYEVYCNAGDVRKKLRPMRRLSFVQNDEIRRSFDTWEKIERMEKMKFIPRHQRGSDNGNAS